MSNIGTTSGLNGHSNNAAPLSKRVLAKKIIEYLDRNFKVNDRFSVKKLKHTFAGVNNYTIGGQIGHLARNGFIKRFDNSADEYIVIRNLAEWQPKSHTYEPAPESADLAQQAPTPALQPILSQAKANETEAISQDSLADTLLELASKVANIIPDLTKIPGDALMAELQRRLDKPARS